MGSNLLFERIIDDLINGRIELAGQNVDDRPEAILYVDLFLLVSGQNAHVTSPV